MPEIIQCPQCERRLKVPDTLRGKAVKCPTCGVAFTADVMETAGPETAPDDMPTPRRDKGPAQDENAEEQTPVRRRRRRVAPLDESDDYEEQLAEREEEE